ncbi:PRC-barrel domain-containing protein (plasmid) [Rhodococcus sp. USK10]|uniref:PRC-barrel domain-containing protein n=1 Tax=Rhodococcus sp. USK10 TaxID=2789739 RepID=UPI001C5FEE6C|nr:PRC-barrel domain-containing protein [Rhodococcus sp. USK10]QYA99931.1 PRC-barrel domain-containing protein [Rhodococcus sp. USK10]
MPKQPPTLIDLDAPQLTMEHPEADIRGHTVFDRGGHVLGDVDGLIVDADERRVRFLRIGSGGFFGLGKTKRLVPVDAVIRIDDVSVHLDRTGDHVARSHVARSAEYDPSLVPDADFYEHLYTHYGYAPFWMPGYTYPYPPRTPKTLPPQESTGPKR